MSYRLTGYSGHSGYPGRRWGHHGLGVVIGNCSSTTGGAGGQRVETCAGLETICDGELYCDTETWSNQTYLEIKGPASLQYHNEARVRALLGYLLKPTPAGSSSPIEDFAYDQGLGPGAYGPKLLPTIQRALDEFNRKFPKARWHLQKDCIPRDGWAYDCYVDSTQNRGASRPELEAILHVPGGDGPSNIMTRAKPGDVLHPGDVMTRQGAAVLPGPWLAEMLRLFAPITATPVLGSGGAKAGDKPAKPKRTTSAVDEARIEPTHRTALVVVAGLAAAAGGYLLVRAST